MARSTIQRRDPYNTLCVSSVQDLGVRKKNTFFGWTATRLLPTGRWKMESPVHPNALQIRATSDSMVLRYGAKDTNPAVQCYKKSTNIVGRRHVMIFYLDNFQAA